MKHFKWLACAILLLPYALAAQNFELDKFKEFQEKHKNLSAEGLMEMYPAGTFLFKAQTDFQSACFSYEVDTVFKLTLHEKALIERHGFMVTERLGFESFGRAYDYIFTKDLPVYVSSDAILHALHMSYDDILKGLEEDVIIPKLTSVLDDMRQKLPALGQKYASQPEMSRMLLDLDIYLTIPTALLSGNETAPVFSENTTDIEHLLSLIEGESPADIQLFASTSRTMDFSQFTPRGHYTQKDKMGGNSLERYFKAMIWLGRTEMMLGAPQNVSPTPTPEDIQRQTVMSVLLTELIVQANTRKSIDEIEVIISSLVGEQDNVTLTNLTQLIAETKISSASDLLDATTLAEFQTVLKTKGSAFQRINSQILMGNSPENIIPPAAFLLFGQRFVIDSYVFSNLVHGKVKYRMLPSSLDVLFAFGNDASAQLLRTDMTTFKEYPLNAAALRYLVDAYDEKFWSQSFYNGWLNTIRTLNPPKQREKLPHFMQTAAWWQKTMNTQLASWAQLRHDNLLYAKQSYSDGIGCSFPESFVEPVPEFYASIANLAGETIEKFKNMEMQSGDGYRIEAYFKTLKSTMDTLSVLAQKELSHIPFDESERNFLRSMIQQNKFAGCGERVYNGWFPNLFYSGEEGLLKDDRVIADVHTAPTDEAGNPVG